MNLHDLETTTQILGLLASAFPGRVMTPELMDLYLWRLSAVDTDLLRAAALHLIDTHPYPTMPTIENIRSAVKQLDAGRGYPTPLEAWGLARGKRHRGTTAERLIDKAVMDAVGWHQMDNASAADTSWNRKAFVERYQELVAQEEGPAPDVRRMVEDYRERIERALPDTQQVRTRMEKIGVDPYKQAEPAEPAKPLGSLAAAYKAELARIAKEKG